MATNPPKKPPEYHNNNNNHHHHQNDTTTIVTSTELGGLQPFSTSTVSTGGTSGSILLKQRRSTCSCSNIAIMQLFHEMKQKFPTVPDHVVSDLVTANCHNRPGCIDSLEKAVLGTPATAQAYPSQSIHSTSLKRRINERKLSKLDGSVSFSGGSSGSSSRESSVDKSSSKSVGGVSAGDAIGSTNFSRQLPNNNNNGIGDVSRDGGSANNTSAADNNPMTTAVLDNNNNRIALSRPNTLAFSGPRPIRAAPLPPISSTITASPELGETVNVQLNVTVSPVASRSPIGQRHTSTLQLQPEPPFSRELAQASSSFNSQGPPLPPGANSRSSTSVNLTLRQPSDSPQSPIHIHASPLKYTAKGFNAQSGIQSKLEITFRDGFGSISAMRTHVPGYDPAVPNHPSSSSNSNSNSIQYGQLQENPYQDYPQHQQMAQYLPTTAAAAAAAAATTAGVAYNESDGLTEQQLYQNYLNEVAITHQLDQKNRLKEEVNRYRQQLNSIRREIYVLEHPLSHIDADQLNREVQLLEEEVDRMQKEVDCAELMGSTSQQPAPAAAAVTHGVTDGLAALSIEGSPSTPAGPTANRPPRPPRPPPPRINQHLHPAPGPPPAASQHAVVEGRTGRSMSAPVPGSTSGGGGGGTTAGEQWTCSLCTFQNHELMTRCEVCSLPKMSVVTSGQDIHIYLSPGQNKIIHSWIVS